jgi:biotin operon repressor
MNGFIKLERGIFDWEWYTEQDTSRMFIHLLLKANHKKARVNGKLIERGQTLTSIPRLSEQLSMSYFKVRKALANLKKTGEISIKTTNNYSLVTISKYSEYQGFYDPKTAGEKQPDDNQNTTNNKDNNVKNTITELREWKEWYLKNNRIIDSVCKNNKFERSFVISNLDGFIKYSENLGNIEESIYEYNSHFLNYLRKIRKSILNGYRTKQDHNKSTF